MNRRYLDDKKFHDLVNWLAKFIHDKIFTLQDIRDAVEILAAQQSVHLTGGSHAVGEANSENYVRWQNGDLPEEPASR